MNASPSAALRPWWMATVLWLAFSLVLAVAGRELFHTAVYEEGDNAANALNIARAKCGAELYGNYSRFGFNHPGPAFFYCYAAGEGVLHDWLGVTPARHNAHLLTLGLLQAAFLAATITLCATQVSQPWMAALFLSGAAGVHLAFVPQAFFGIWPPFVLLLPYACFLVCCARVSLGHWSILPVLVLSAGFLVHGHVAQVIFVAPLSGVALILGIRSRRRQKAESPTATVRWLTVMLALVLTCPLLADLEYGRDSNFYRILLHLRFGVADRPNWSDALGAAFSYFGYGLQQEHWWGPEARGTAAEFFREYRIGLAVWALILSATGGWFWKTRRTETTAAIRLARRLALTGGGALLLAFFWAGRQDGGITFFNSYFTFGLMLALLLPGSIALGEYFGQRLRWLALIGAIIAGLLVAHRGQVDARRWNPLGQEVARNLPALLQADGRPNTVKVLLFDEWIAPVTLAAALQRSGVDFRVSPGRRVMFGAQHVLKASEGLAQTGRISWWRLVGAQTAQPGDWPVGGGTFLHLAPPPKLPSLPARLSFAKGGSALPHVVFGISEPEEAFSWTEATVAVVAFRTARTDAARTIAIDASAISRPNRPVQHVRAFLNGHLVGVFEVGPARDRFVFSAPAEIWNNFSDPQGSELVLELPLAVVLSREEWSVEHRELALRLHAISFQ